MYSFSKHPKHRQTHQCSACLLNRKKGPLKLFYKSRAIACFCKDLLFNSEAFQLTFALRMSELYPHMMHSFFFLFAIILQSWRAGNCQLAKSPNCTNLTPQTHSPPLLPPHVTCDSRAMKSMCTPPPAPFLFDTPTSCLTEHTLGKKSNDSNQAGFGWTTFTAL